MQLLTTREACAALKITRKTLTKWRDEEGCPYHRLSSHIYRYHLPDVLAWAEERFKNKNTPGNSDES